MKMGRVTLMTKVTRMAEMEGEKDQAAQLSSHVPLAAMLVRSVVCRKSVGGSTFAELVWNHSIHRPHLSAGRHLPGQSSQGLRLLASIEPFSPPIHPQAI